MIFSLSIFIGRDTMHFANSYLFLKMHFILFFLHHARLDAHSHPLGAGVDFWLITWERMKCLSTFWTPLSNRLCASVSLNGLKIIKLVFFARSLVRFARDFRLCWESERIHTCCVYVMNDSATTKSGRNVESHRVALFRSGQIFTTILRRRLCYACYEMDWNC